MEDKELKEMVDSLRNRIAELLSDESLVNSDEVMKVSKEMDELLNKYYYHKKRE